MDPLSAPPEKSIVPGKTALVVAMMAIPEKEAGVIEMFPVSARKTHVHLPQEYLDHTLLGGNEHAYLIHEMVMWRMFSLMACEKSINQGLELRMRS